MAGSVNKVILIGNLGRDPEVRSFQNGGKVVNLTVATSETWSDKSSGERKEKTEWHRVAIFNEALGKIAEQYLKKGSTVYLEGQLETRKWQDQSGADRYTTEIVLKQFRGELTLLGGKADDDGQGREYETSPKAKAADHAQRPAQQRSPMNDLDGDSIPFAPQVL